MSEFSSEHHRAMQGLPDVFRDILALTIREIHVTPNGQFLHFAGHTKKGHAVHSIPFSEHARLQEVAEAEGRYDLTGQIRSAIANRQSQNNGLKPVRQNDNPRHRYA